MSLTDEAVAAELAPAGLAFVERISIEVQLPLPDGKSAASSWREHGRFDSRPDEVVDVDDPDLVAKVNAGWWRMANEFGLLDEHRHVDVLEFEDIRRAIRVVANRLHCVSPLADSGCHDVDVAGRHFGSYRRGDPRYQAAWAAERDPAAAAGTSGRGTRLRAARLRGASESRRLSDLSSRARIRQGTCNWPVSARAADRQHPERGLATVMTPP